VLLEVLDALEVGAELLEDAMEEEVEMENDALYGVDDPLALALALALVLPTLLTTTVLAGPTPFPVPQTVGLPVAPKASRTRCAYGTCVCTPASSA